MTASDQKDGLNTTHSPPTALWEKKWISSVLTKDSWALVRVTEKLFFLSHGIRRNAVPFLLRENISSRKYPIQQKYPFSAIIALNEMRERCKKWRLCLLMTTNFFLMNSKNISAHTICRRFSWQQHWVGFSVWQCSGNSLLNELSFTNIQ